jgi:hypothetical protein
MFSDKTLGFSSEREKVPCSTPPESQLQWYFTQVGWQTCPKINTPHSPNGSNKRISVYNQGIEVTSPQLPPLHNSPLAQPVATGVELPFVVGRPF